MRISFVKMHGLGNDFVLLDERQRSFALNATQLRLLADRHLGVGCDQILCLERPVETSARARYRIFNADGSEAEHCGNGVRCVALYLRLRGESADNGVAVEVGDELCELTFEQSGDIRVDMGRPRFAPQAVPLAVAATALRYEVVLDGVVYEFGAVSMGNPHAVLQVAEVNSAPIARLGSALQRSGVFPAGVNVGFMQIVSPNHIRLRVFERGVGETRACGTGACAAVAVGRRWGVLDDVVAVDLNGGRLRIEWNGESAHSLWMTGPATFVFEGTIDL